MSSAPTENPPIGLALSGGGIRSATFNLGVLQALAKAGLLGTFDYLSTVSGGGYIGGFWSRWRSRHPEGAPDFPRRGEDGPEAPEIRHLRQFSNFLSPRVGMLTVDTGRMLVAGLSSAIPSVLAAVSVIVVALGLYIVVAALLLDMAPVLAWEYARPTMARWRPVVVLAVGTALFLGWLEVRWRRKAAADPPAWGAYALAGVLGTTTTTLGWMLVRTAWPGQTQYPAGQWLPLARGADGQIPWLHLFAPCVAWGVGVLALVAMRWLYSRQVRGLPWRIRRGAHDRVQMRLLMLAGGWGAASLLWCAGVYLHGLLSGPRTGLGIGTLAGAIAIGSGLFARLQKMLGKESGSGAVMSTLSRLKPILPQLLAYLTVGLTIAAAVAGLHALGGEPRVLWGVIGGAVLIILLVLITLDPNEVALHSFYKSRIVRAYLGASNPKTLPQRETSAGSGRGWRARTEEHEEDDIHLNRLGEDREHRPIHLVCCAANDQADTSEMDDLRRGASSAVLSAEGFQVGDAFMAWDGTHNPAITLGTSLTASGAAFNTLMGSYSVKLGPAVTFLAAALNLRLGVWLRHPEGMRRRVEEAWAREAERAEWSVWGGRAKPAWVRRAEVEVRRKPRLIGLPFFLEMFGMARAEGPFVHLSDGGHFENMGVYELVRRRCRIIVASDCGADPKCTFNDVGTLVRRVRQDFGVEIDIDLAPLRPAAETGRAASAVVLGRISYPGADAEPGVLILLKPALVGDEPADIGQYRSRCREFPHETTADQFYDEAQWESYRRLGEHVAEGALRAIRKKKAPGGKKLWGVLEGWCGVEG